MRKNPEIDLSAEFVTTIWRDSDATNIGTNIGTSGNNIATDLLVDEYFFIISCLF